MKYVIYHDKCTDGFGAAWVAWQKFNTSAIYLPLNHYDPIPEFSDNSEIYILDFCFSKDVLVDLAKSHKVVVLDHHQSAHKNVAELILNPIANLELIFDMGQSGAEMAWNYWFKDQPLPELIAYIKDRDLGHFHLPKTEVIISALMTYPKEFTKWNNLSVNNLYQEGLIISQVQHQLMLEMVEKHHFATIGGVTIPVVNATAWWSDITKILLDKYPEAPFAAAYYAIDNHRIKWSLRSRENSLFNVAEISSLYGGGGHANSGGFSAQKNEIDFHSLNEILVKKVA